ncbi:MAG: coproporphyrinogen III oxidase family protein [Lentisphaerae bacterium]|nr:coproporphyrinogen III oxidase family protein [Lentisphaerota bacterium]
MNCYIHVPFCANKCGYCAFYSETAFPPEMIDRYLGHLQKRICPEALETLYIGGGTPTLLSENQLARFISMLREKFTFVPGAEVSIEANPETLTEKKVELLRSFFTRISLGVQSFDAGLRAKIGRRCSDEALDRALKLLKEAAFPHWNCDLIYSLPDETPENWKKDLHLAAQCGVDHISCYSLTPERSAALGKEFAIDDEKEREMYDTAGEILGNYGIKRYEISNYARPGCECCHNVNVWRGGILRGYGPSAADFDGIDRHIAAESLSNWLADAAPETDRIPTEARLNEIFAVNLRTVAGWTPQLWEAVPGSDPWSNRLDIAGKAAEIYPGCLQISDSEIKLSPGGLLFWNDIAAELL